MHDFLHASPIARVDTGDQAFKLPAAFAASCFVGALGTDIVYATDPDMVWVTFSVWAITVGLLVAAVAAVAGLVARALRREVDTLGSRWPYLLGFAAVVVVEIFNAFVHSRDAYQAVVPEGIALSALAVLLLVLTAIAGRARARARFRSERTT